MGDVGGVRVIRERREGRASGCRRVRTDVEVEGRGVRRARRGAVGFGAMEAAEAVGRRRSVRGSLGMVG